MARPRKSPQFAIYHDAGIPTSDAAYQPTLEDAILEQEEEDDAVKDGDEGGLQYEEESEDPAAGGIRRNSDAAR